MNQDMSIITLVLHASPVVQLVMAGLLLVSLASWTVIFGKFFGLKRVRQGNEDFERDFWSGRNLNELQQASAAKAHTAPLERIFASGMREFMKLRERRLDAAAQLDGARRAMRASFQRELDVIESNLSFLASVGSVSPYVGLFGTVWGIMHAFVGLSNLQQVTLATVAPGIAEALVATAIGLFAAIPAVIAYNRLSRDIDRIAIQLETFIEEFSNILQRSAHRARRLHALHRAVLHAHGPAERGAGHDHVSRAGRAVGQGRGAAGGVHQAVGAGARSGLHAGACGGRVRRARVQRDRAALRPVGGAAGLGA